MTNMNKLTKCIATVLLGLTLNLAEAEAKSAGAPGGNSSGASHSAGAGSGGGHNAGAGASSGGHTSGGHGFGHRSGGAHVASARISADPCMTQEYLIGGHLVKVKGIPNKTEVYARPYDDMGILELDNVWETSYKQDINGKEIHVLLTRTNDNDCFVPIKDVITRRQNTKSLDYAEKFIKHFEDGYTMGYNDKSENKERKIGLNVTHYVYEKEKNPPVTTTTVRVAAPSDVPAVSKKAPKAVKKETKAPVSKSPAPIPAVKKSVEKSPCLPLNKTEVKKTANAPITEKQIQGYFDEGLLIKIGDNKVSITKDGIIKLLIAGVSITALIAALGLMGYVVVTKLRHRDIEKIRETIPQRRTREYQNMF
jgi:hypothetical protein